MNQPPGNGRPPQGYPPPGYPQQGYGQQQPVYGQQPAYGQQPPAQQGGCGAPQPQPYGQPQQAPQGYTPAPSHDPQAFAATAYAGSSFAQQAQQYVQQYHQQQPTAGGYGQAQPYGQPPQGFGMPQAFAGSVPQRRGMPSVLCFVFGLLAVVVALGFDILFLKIDIPGAGGYVWYATTALSFAGAGYASAMWTKAGRGLVSGVVIATGILYGAADIGLALVLDDVGLGEAIYLAGIGVAIAIGTGLGGAYRAWRSRDD